MDVEAEFFKPIAHLASKLYQRRPFGQSASPGDTTPPRTPAAETEKMYGAMVFGSDDADDHLLPQSSPPEAPPLPLPSQFSAYAQDERDRLARKNYFSRRRNLLLSRHAADMSRTIARSDLSKPLTPGEYARACFCSVLAGFIVLGIICGLALVIAKGVNIYNP